jgi:hypothetical protein
MWLPQACSSGHLAIVQSDSSVAQRKENQMSITQQLQQCYNVLHPPLTEVPSICLLIDGRSIDTNKGQP